VLVLSRTQPKYTGSLNFVTITGSSNVNIQCGVEEFGDGASCKPNFIPSWAAVNVGGGFLPVPGMPVTVPARQPGAALTEPLQVVVNDNAAVTGVSVVLSLFRITIGNLKLPTCWPLTNDGLVEAG
jgi:hypothetical protein